MNDLRQRVISSGMASAKAVCSCGWEEFVFESEREVAKRKADKKLKKHNELAHN